MLDIAFIRDNTEVVERACADKGVKVDVAKLVKLDDQRRSLQQRIEELRSERNQLASQTKGAKPDAKTVQRSKDLRTELAELEDQYEPLLRDFQKLLSLVPNIPSEKTPVGKDDKANKVIRQWGDKPEFAYPPKPHWQLGAERDLIDMEHAAKMSGSRFAYLKGGLVRMQFALINWLLSELTDPKKLVAITKKAKLTVPEAAFEPIVPPSMLSPEVFERTGRLSPAEDKYFIDKDNLYLAGSAEQTLLPLHMDETLDESKLPIRYLGYSTAFRREAGSYGKDTRGIIRVHQFDKLEMLTVCTPEQSDSEFELFTAIQEHILQSLKLPYQVVEISTGDMGKPDYRQVDMETWMPGQAAYRETHTADNNTDYQARRLNVRFTSAAGNKQLVHIHDGTAMAVGRLLAAIMENYQQSDGSIAVPTLLRPMIGTDRI